MSSENSVPESAAGGETPAPDELVPVRRSFPVPKQKAIVGETVEAPAGNNWQEWGVRGLLGVAVILAGVAMWVRFRPENSPVSTAPADPTPVVAVVKPPEPVPAGPPDAARDVYLSPPPTVAVAPPAPAVPAPQPTAVAAAVPAPSPAPVPAPSPAESTAAAGLFETPDSPPAASEKEPNEVKPPPAPRPALEELETRYLAALERAATGAAATETAAWAAEIERVKSGTPLPAPDESQPGELQRLQSIYRREADKQNTAVVTAPAPPSPDARRVELYFMADDAVELLLNGTPAAPEYLAGSAQEAGAVQKAALSLKPGDVLGFRCSSKGGQRNFCLMARSGVLPLFASNERWEAAVDPDPAWMKGEGKSSVRPQVLRGRVDYNAANAARFEKLAKAHSADYSVLWAGNGDTAAFRYRIRPVDLPEKATLR